MPAQAQPSQVSNQTGAGTGRGGEGRGITISSGLRMPNCTRWTLATSAGEYGNLASIPAGLPLPPLRVSNQGAPPHADPNPAARAHALGFRWVSECAFSRLRRANRVDRPEQIARLSCARGRGKGNEVPLRKGLEEWGWGYIYRRLGRCAGRRGW
jgi:hypothetical protein